MQKIKWEKQLTCAAISSLYVNYVKKHLSAIPKYRQQKIRHMLNAIKKVGPKIKISPTAPLTVSKDNFLSNLKNKQNIITFIARSLQQNQIKFGPLMVMQTSQSLQQQLNVRKHRKQY